MLKVKLFKKRKMKFIDLFAGLGGFHLALKQLGHSCVFACDIEEELRTSYQKNFGILPEGDIRKVPTESIPSHDILCAGFPCQPFSKAGLQEGLKDKERGGLFYQIMRIVEYHKPEYILMENVPNIRMHDNKKTWTKIENLLRGAGYDISAHELSPHHFGIPQIRLRTYIVGRKGKLNGFKWPEPNGKGNITSVLSVLNKNPVDARSISPKVRKCLDTWQEFLNIIPTDEEIPHPIWAMEFRATYPYESTTPHAMQLKKLREYRGSFGIPLRGIRKKELFKNLPSHATRPDTKFPKWKIGMIKRNREFYQKHKKILDPWITKIKEFPSSFQKLEWNVGDEKRDMNKYIIQCRASGIRVKRPTTSPSLVAMNSTQIPIISWENRYVTPQECSRLQSMDKLILPAQRSKAYQALGNAVNVKVVKLITSALLMEGQKNDNK